MEIKRSAMFIVSPFYSSFEHAVIKTKDATASSIVSPRYRISFMTTSF
jgi:hypothetical protein